MNKFNDNDFVIVSNNSDDKKSYLTQIENEENDSNFKLFKTKLGYFENCKLWQPINSEWIIMKLNADFCLITQYFKNNTHPFIPQPFLGKLPQFLNVKQPLFDYERPIIEIDYFNDWQPKENELVVISFGNENAIVLKHKKGANYQNVEQYIGNILL